MRFLCADVCIAKGILMFIWGKPNAEVSCFLLALTADMCVPKGIIRLLCADVSIAGGILMFF